MSLSEEIYLLGMEAPGFDGDGRKEGYREAIKDVLDLIAKHKKELKPNDE